MSKMSRRMYMAVPALMTGFLIWACCDSPLIDINSKVIGIAIFWFALLYWLKR